MRRSKINGCRWSICRKVFIVCLVPGFFALSPLFEFEKHYSIENLRQIRNANTSPHLFHLIFDFLSRSIKFLLVVCENICFPQESVFMMDYSALKLGSIGFTMFRGNYSLNLFFKSCQRKKICGRYDYTQKTDYRIQNTCIIVWFIVNL